MTSPATSATSGSTHPTKQKPNQKPAQNGGISQKSLTSGRAASMEPLQQLNKVQLRGHIGSIKVLTVGCSKVAKFSVATNYAYKDAQGYCVIETTWSNVVAWEGKDITDLSQLQKGDRVEITGRLRNQRYTISEGEDRYTSEILAQTLRALGDAESFTFET